MFSGSQNHRRTNETPMDFEWQGHAPVDPNTPFPQSKPGHKRGFESSQISSSFVGGSSKPASQFRNPSFTTPRKGTFDIDLMSEASGIESSPGDIADGEDTPELPKSSSNMTAFAAGSSKQPIFGKYGAGFLGNSPGRAEQRRGKYANVIANKIRKRQRIDRDYSIARGKRDASDMESESDPEDGGPRKGNQRKKQPTPHWFASFMSGIESRPHLPHVLSYWGQVIMNFFLIGLVIYGIATFWLTIRSDVNQASEDAKADVLSEIAKCARDYVDNKCGPDMRLPALEAVCNNWERCMNRDPDSVGRARISAHTFAQIFNSFIEPISYKAMIFMALIVTVSLLVNNLAFGMVRSKTPHPAPSFYPSTPHHQSYQWAAPPQTPQQTVGYDMFAGQTFPQIMPSQTPGQRSPSKGSRSPSKGSRSPSKGERSPSKGSRY